MRRRELGVDVLLANEASKAQGWIVDGGDDEDESDITSVEGETSEVDNTPKRRSPRNVVIRELHDEDSFQMMTQKMEEKKRILSLSLRLIPNES